MPRKSSSLYNSSYNAKILANKSLSFEDLSQKYVNSIHLRRHRPMQVSRASRVEAVECPENPRVRAAQLIFKSLLLNAWRKRRQEVENIRQQMKNKTELIKGNEGWETSYIEMGDPHNEVKALRLLLSHEKEKLSMLKAENNQSQGMVHLPDQSIDNITDGVKVTEYFVKDKRKDVQKQIQDESYQLQLRHKEIQQLEAQVNEIELSEENKLNGLQQDKSTLNQYLCKYLLKSLAFILLPNVTK